MIFLLKIFPAIASFKKYFNLFGFSNDLKFIYPKKREGNLTGCPLLSGIGWLPVVPTW